MENALDFTAPGGKVEVTYFVTHERLCISVTDNGIGIASQDQNLIFHKYFQADNQTLRRVKGTGLGLYFGREFARRHGGDILVNSTNGVGSRFTLELPLASVTVPTCKLHFHNGIR